MIFNPSKYLGMLALLLPLALIVSCAPASKTQTTLLAMHSPYDSQDLKLKINGQDAVEALDSNERIVDLLDILDAPPAKNIKGRINKLLNSPSARLAGLGGIQSRIALDAARVTLDPSGKFKGKLTTFVVQGKIQESIWGESGFYYKPGDPMHIWVQMITTATRISGGGVPKVKRWAEMFRIEVPVDAVTVEPKVPDTGNGVFPDFADVAFPISSTMATDLNFKLWAVGNDVRVTNYWIDNNYNGVGDPNYMPNKKYTMANHPPKYHNIFEMDAEACIDMMFMKDPSIDITAGGALANGELPPNTEPPYYCLGRCRNPPIVNTR